MLGGVVEMFWKSGLERYRRRGDGQSIGAPLRWVGRRHPRFLTPSPRLHGLDVVQQAKMARQFPLELIRCNCLGCGCCCLCKRSGRFA